MTRPEGPESADGGGFELWRDPSPCSRPCAFCRQEIGEAPSTSCRKCGTFYHPDCWAANDGRCAVYGCAPLSAPPPPSPPPPRQRRVPTWTPEPTRTFSFSGLG